MPGKSIISVVGAHGGDELDRILDKKIQDIEMVGFAFWMTRSVSIRPETICPLREIDCCFISASGSSKKHPYGNAKPAVTSEIALEYSVDMKSWVDIPEFFTITGKLSDGLGRAMVINELERCDNMEIDLWKWSSYLRHEVPLNFRPWNSSIPSINVPPSTLGPKARTRRVIARARLCYPFCVWLR